MPISLEERIDLAEEHVLGVFMDPRSASTILSLSREDTDILKAPAERGELTLERLGLSREDLARSVARIGSPSHDPEVDAVRAAYLALAVNRDMVRDAIREIEAAPAMRF